MKILIADKFPERYVTAIKNLGHTVVYEPGYKAADIAAKIGDAEVVVVRSTEVTADAVQGFEKTLPDHPGRRRNEQHRQESRQRGGDLRVELPGHELRGRGGAGHGPDLRAGSAARGERGGFARGQVEQGRVLQGGGPAREGAGRDRRRHDRPGSDRARAGVRPEGQGLEPLADPGKGGGPGRGLCGDDRRTGAVVRHHFRSPRADERHEGHHFPRRSSLP